MALNLHIKPNKKGGDVTYDCDSASVDGHLKPEIALRARIDQMLVRILPPADEPPTDLHQAMHYALLSPGKRLRPLLLMLTVGAGRADDDSVVRLSCVAELVHTASLILDDLPCMDDATVRRNQPCTHIKFGESTAILAAINLLNLAYDNVGRASCLSFEQRGVVLGHLCRVVGSMGLVGGQIADLRNTRCSPHSQLRDVMQEISSNTGIRELYYQKTGCLFEFALVSGGRVGSMSAEALTALSGFARCFGLLFQIVDDLIDQVEGKEQAGKDVGQDAHKATFTSNRSVFDIVDTTETVYRQAQQYLSQALLADSGLAALLERQVQAVRGYAGKLEQK